MVGRALPGSRAVASMFPPATRGTLAGRYSFQRNGAGPCERQRVAGLSKVLALESPKASAMRVFEITGLASVFTIRSEAASDATTNGDHDVHSEDTLNA